MVGRGWWSAVAEVFLPDACAVCDDVLPGGGAFCAVHADDVTVLPEAHCARCAEPGVFPGRCCSRCRGGVPWLRAWAPFEHEGAVARAIHRFKYEDRADLSRPLGALLSASANVREWAGVVVPMPLHVTRFRERKFDQAALLAHAFCEATGHRLELNWLHRARATQRQVGLSEAAREENVAGAFEAHGLVEGQNVILLDDVLTSGATARAATVALRSRGARSVSVLTLARARSERAG